jgi:capsular exopolysaccharide synthesis family protein
MSRIFDALQRSEGEHSEIDVAELPAGPELLRRVEHRVASERGTAVSSHQDRETARVAKDNGVVNPKTDHSDPSNLQVSVAPEDLSAEERSALFATFRSLPVSLAPEGRLVSLTDRESPTAEAIRLLGVRLRNLRRLRPLKKVLVTSSIPREGKTTIAANLACALAYTSEEKTLIIEGDVRLPALRQMFGIEKVPGICELVQDGLSLPDCVFHLDGAGVWILPTGTIPKNPLEILQSQRLRLLMDELTASFDWIIIDSPPILPLADTSIWMRLADGILMVTRQGVTEKQQLQKGLEALESHKVLGAVLNGSVASAYSGYYYRSTASSESLDR